MKIVLLIPLKNGLNNLKRNDMKNVYLIPTDKPSEFYSIDGKHKLANSTIAMDWYISSVGYKPHNIYITSGEEIKESDWVLSLTDDESYLEVYKYEGTTYLGEDKKIILTTDQELISNGVQAIDDEFLEWFVKNPSCERVDVEKTFVTNSGLGYQEYAVLDSNFKVIEINAKIPQTSYYLDKITILNTYEYAVNYKIIIPQEELKCTCERPGDWNCIYCVAAEFKQETLEEAAERIYPVVIKPILDVYDDGVSNQIGEEDINEDSRESFIDGANWQSERMYDVLENLWVEYRAHTNNEDAWSFKEWLLEQFKKK
jgi:hypothetical protein